MNRLKKNIFIAVVIIAVIFGVLSLSSNFLVDFQWFKEIGYLGVFFTQIVAVLKLMIPTFLVCFLIILFYGKSILKKFKNSSSINNKFKTLNRVNWILSIILAFVLSYSISSRYWYRILQLTNSVDFNYKDPIFNNDASFYVFKLPIIQSIYGVLLALIITLVFVTFVLFLIVNLKNKILKKEIYSYGSMRDGFKNFAGKQLAALSAGLLVLISVGYVLKSFGLLYSPRGILYGAGYTDVKVTLLFYRIISIVAIIGAIVVFVSIKKMKIKPIIASGALIAILIILEPISASLMQHFIVKSNEMEFEKPYITNHVEATRRAYNIDNITQNDFAPKYDLDNNKLSQNKDIIRNLKVNSIPQVWSFYNQVQVIKNFYNFNDVDTDRYKINGEYTQVFLAPREIDYANMNTWQNKHLRYTHGYGIAMSKVNSVTSEGQPDFVMNDLPTTNKTDIPLENPRIYFGEGDMDYAVVDTNIDEFDYPSGGENATNKYDGASGIKMNIFNRILFTINQKSPRVLFSGDINSNSKILLNRNIMDRVKKIAPFLTYDKDPYMAIDNGKLYWIMDAYTTTDKFPYSQPNNSINYIRNSVKVTVDAYDGTTNFYVVDKEDPIAVSYSKIFKGLFKDGSEMPEGLRSHFKYPQDMFKIQCEMLGNYHVTNPTVFFTGEDKWQISSNIKEVEGEENINESLYMMTRLPGEKNPEMLMFEYFNITGKQNMVSLLGARMDGDNYGKLVLYKFPPEKTVYSPVLFKNKIRTDSEISKEISLWQGKGAKVDYGDTIILPINDSLLYLETIYLKADSENSLPEVKKIIVSDGEKIVGADTVENGLAELFGYKEGEKKEEKGKPSTDNGATLNDASKEDLSKIKDLYNNAINSQKQGNWAEYGKYIEDLGKLLESLDKK